MKLISQQDPFPHLIVDDIYSEDELKFQILLSLITLPYQGFIAP